MCIRIEVILSALDRYFIGAKSSFCELRKGFIDAVIFDLSLKG